MSSTSQFAEVAALAGDPTRAAMLQALMDGRAFTASELASLAGVTAQTASGHLLKMTEAGLLMVKPQGRHRYYRLASRGVAEMMEAIMRVAAAPQPTRKLLRVGPSDLALRHARTCYDHLAGELGVAIAGALVRGGYLELSDDAATVTAQGIDFLTAMGVDVFASDGDCKSGSPHSLCRPCLDWSERRLHLAGKIATALCARSFAAGWIRRLAGTRAVTVTPKGERIFRTEFGIVTQTTSFLTHTLRLGTDQPAPVSVRAVRLPRPN